MMCRQTLKKMVKVLEEKIMKINAIHVHEMQHLVQENVNFLHEISDLNQKFHRLSMIFKDLQVLQTHLSTINDLISYNKKVRKLTICIITYQTQTHVCTYMLANYSVKTFVPTRQNFKPYGLCCTLQFVHKNKQNQPQEQICFNGHLPSYYTSKSPQIYYYEVTYN